MKKIISTILAATMIMGQTVTTFADSKTNEVVGVKGENQIVTASDGWSEWTDPVVTYGNKKNDAQIAADLAAVLAAIAGGPKTSAVLLAIAQVYIDLQSDIYYKKETCYRGNIAMSVIQIKSTTTFYENSDYTGYIDSYTSIVDYNEAMRSIG